MSSATQQRAERRRAAVPPITYPPELPVSQAREQLASAIRDHQVVVVAGETGSGKTTQLPKICLQLGRGIDGMIGHTQPRRIAARTVAERIADELKVELGQQVGYQFRFTARTSERTLVKLMTDGILLAEIQRDPQLRAYDTIILDEAHERSLTIDFLLGYLKQLLPKRPDLKVIVTSATIDPHRFAAHFGGAPVVEVSGRMYPVEVRYRDDDASATAGGYLSATESDPIQAIADAVEELAQEPRGDEPPGDVLVFLSGEREIRDTADALRALQLPDTEVLPLYARLAVADQHKVFAPHSGRRIVLATNVAETSLTVPGIRYVVDPGTARISRYSQRTKVQRLPIEPVSQASANQRAGRCGRVADGICIRLYSHEDFEARPAFTDPEIVRTNLAAVILQMTALGLGDVAAFPFLDPPDQRSVRDAVQLLHELGAVDSERSDRKLTPVGKQLAALPVDPRIARMLVEADRNACLSEVLVIASALSIQDVRERPADQEFAADQLHARFADDRSDFTSCLNLWEHLQTEQKARTSSSFRRMCKAEFLHHLRVREWQDLHGQLRATSKNLGLHRNDTPAEPDAIHRAVLAGLLSQIGMRDRETRQFLGPRGTKFTVWPGSGLAKGPPSWLMAAELVETARLWARTVAAIDPAWAEELAQHLVTRTYSEPRWSAKRAAVVATEKVTLYGLPLVTARTVGYARFDPELSRELFVRRALVEGEWRSDHAFLTANRRALEDLSDLEHRARRRDLVVDDDVLFAFYDARIPADVVSGRHFDAWWKRSRGQQPDLLSFTRELLLGSAGVHVPTGEQYPDAWRQGDLQLPLRYRFDPGADDDGVTVAIPLVVLNQVRPDGFDWLVPGLRAELVEALLRSLPKELRRRLVPLPDVVARVLPRLDPGGGSLLDVLQRELRALTGVVVARDAWDLQRLPPHLRVTFRVLDGGTTLATGKDLVALQRQLAGQVRVIVSDAAGDLERRGLVAWTIGTLPRTVTRTRDGHVLQGYPSLVDEGSSVGVRVLLTESEQRGAMWQGTRRLLLLAVPPPARAVAGALDTAAKLAFARAPHGSVSALLEDCATAAIDTLTAANGGPAWDASGFEALRNAVRDGMEDAVLAIVRDVVDVLGVWGEVQSSLASVGSPALAPVLDDVNAQVAALVHPGFVTTAGSGRLRDLVRYLRAAERRMAKALQDPARDHALRVRVEHVQDEYEQLRRTAGVDPAAVRSLRWMIEELRVSLFAQQIGTPGPISEQRVYRAIAELAAGRTGAAT